MSLHLVVCIKSVVKAAPKGVARRTPDNSELNPYDRPALEAALQLKESMGGRITALSMGPAVSGEALAEAMAMGVDAAILINDPALAESDTLVTSRVLATAVQKIGDVDLLFFGTRAADSDTGQVGPQTAAGLDIPFVGGARQMQRQDGEWTIRRTLDDWEEVWQVRPPAAVTINPRSFPPRALDLGRIGQVFDQPETVQWSLADLDLAPDQVGLAGSPTRVAALKPIRRDRQCEMLQGEPQDQVAALMERLTQTGAIAS